MCSRPRGQAIIINNQKFDDEVTYPFRQGADVDADNLDNLFTQLDFKVRHQFMFVSYNLWCSTSSGFQIYQHEEDRDSEIDDWSCRESRQCSLWHVGRLYSQSWNGPGKVSFIRLLQNWHRSGCFQVEIFLQFILMIIFSCGIKLTTTNVLYNRLEAFSGMNIFTYLIF